MEYPNNLSKEEFVAWLVREATVHESAVIKPIETEHEGVTYRSRLEARWAIFLKSIFLPYVKIHYEPEGYELEDGTWYLPDFQVEIGTHVFFVEIKPSGGVTDEAIKKCKGLSRLRETHLVEGMPDNHVAYVFINGELKPKNYNSPYAMGFNRLQAEEASRFQFRNKK